MGMMRFGTFFPELAETETREVHILEPVQDDGRLVFPVNNYGFEDLDRTERGCDCRRVMLNVYALKTLEHVATINHGFEKPDGEDSMFEQTFLDPLNKQSRWAGALLDAFKELLPPDEVYSARLVRHYQLFKSVVEDSAHPLHRLLLEPTGGAKSPLRGEGPTRPVMRSRFKKRKPRGHAWALPTVCAHCHLTSPHTLPFPPQGNPRHPRHPKEPAWAPFQ